MSQPFKGMPITVDQACEQVGGLVLISGNLNGPMLEDPVPCQSILSRPEVNLTNPEVAEPVFTKDALSPGNLGGRKQKPVALHPVHTRINESKVAFGEPQSFSPPFSQTDSHPYEPNARLLPALCGRDLAQHVPYTGTVFTNFSIDINHLSIQPEDHNSSAPHDYALEIGFSTSPTQLLLVGSQQTQAHEVPRMLSRFLRVDGLNDSLRYEASIAISEGRVQEGEDILKRKMLEEYWQWNLSPLSTMAMGLSTPSERSHSMEDVCIEGDRMTVWRTTGYLEDR